MKEPQAPATAASRAPGPTAASEALQRRALECFPGGVNSPVRAFKGVGGVPRFIASARGATITDVDGNRYIDYVLGWGPILLGHAHPVVTAAVERQAREGVLYGASTRLEVELAERVKRFYPAAERIRFVSTGTEATMSALRVARAATAATASSSWTAATTATATRSWCAAARGSRRWASPIPPACPPPR